MTFIVTTLPGSVITVVRSIHHYYYGQELELAIKAIRFAYNLQKVNHGINFIVYSVTGSVFQQALIKLCCPCRRNAMSTPGFWKERDFNE